MVGPPPDDQASSESAAKRREARRASLVFGKASSFAELEAEGLAYWSRVSLGERFQATVELVRESWYVQGQGGPVPRLDRLTYGVRALRS